MCGIVAVFGKVGPKEKRAFELLLSIISARGLDGTGVAAFDDKHVNVVKNDVPPLHLMWSKEYKELMSKPAYGYIGHCRLATNGNISPTITHPFQHGNITLVHNGTLHQKMKTDAKTVNDSDSICARINEEGIDKAWDYLFGAAALVYWDNEAKKISAITNGDRPLVIAGTEDDATLFIASEPIYLNKMAYAMDIAFKKDTVYKFNKDVLYSYAWDGTKISEENRKLEKTYGYKGQSSLPFGKTNDNTGTVKDENGSNKIVSFPRQTTAGAGVNVTTFDLEEPDDEIEDMYAIDTTYRYIGTEAQFNKKYKSCFFCGGSLFGTMETTKVIDDSIAVCEGCYEVAVANQFILNPMAMRSA